MFTVTGEEGGDSGGRGWRGEWREEQKTLEGSCFGTTLPADQRHNIRYAVGLQRNLLCICMSMLVKSTSVSSDVSATVFDFNQGKKTHGRNFCKLPKVVGRGLKKAEDGESLPTPDGDGKFFVSCHAQHFPQSHRSITATVVCQTNGGMEEEGGG